jgi:regulator of RNase E activity RraA
MTTRAGCARVSERRPAASGIQTRNIQAVCGGVEVFSNDFESVDCAGCVLISASLTRFAASLK